MRGLQLQRLIWQICFVAATLWALATVEGTTSVKGPTKRGITTSTLSTSSSSDRTIIVMMSRLKPSSKSRGRRGVPKNDQTSDRSRVPTSTQRRRLKHKNRHKSRVFVQPKQLRTTTRKGGHSHKNSYVYNPDDFPATLKGFYHEHGKHSYHYHPVEDHGNHYHYDHDHDHEHQDQDHDHEHEPTVHPSTHHPTVSPDHYHDHYHHHDTIHPTYYPTFYSTANDDLVVYEYSGAKHSKNKVVKQQHAPKSNKKSKGGRKYHHDHDYYYPEEALHDHLHDHDYYYEHDHPQEDPHWHPEQDYYYYYPNNHNNNNHHAHDHYHHDPAYDTDHPTFHPTLEGDPVVYYYDEYYHSHTNNKHHHPKSKGDAVKYHHHLHDYYPHHDHPEPLDDDHHHHEQDHQPPYYCNSKRSKKRASKSRLYDHNYEEDDNCIPRPKSSKKSKKSYHSKSRHGMLVRPPVSAPSHTHFPTFVPADGAVVQPSSLDYSFSNATMPRQPTPQEEQALLEETNRFYTDLFQSGYGEDFVSFDSRNAVFSLFASGAAAFPITLNFEAVVEFAEGGAAPPTMEEVLSVMQSANYDLYVLEYLRTLPAENIFAGTQQALFGAPPPDDDDTLQPTPQNMIPVDGEPTQDPDEVVGTTVAPTPPGEVVVELCPFGLLFDSDREAAVPTEEQYLEATLVIQQYFDMWFASGYNGEPPEMTLYVPGSTNLVLGDTAFSQISGAFADYTGSAVFRGDNGYVVPSQEELDMSLEMLFMEPNLQGLLDYMFAELSPGNPIKPLTIYYVENSVFRRRCLPSEGRRSHHQRHQHSQKSQSRSTLKRGMLVSAISVLLLYGGFRAWRESQKQHRIRRSGPFFGGDDILMEAKYDDEFLDKVRLMIR